MDGLIRNMWFVQAAAVLFAWCLFFFPLVASAGFGVSPSYFEELNLVPGSTLERTFYLVQGTPEQDLLVELSVESDKAIEWITFPDYENNQATIPAGVQQFPIRAIINVPTDVPEDIYKAFVRINSIPQSNGGQVTIALAAKTAFHLVVGDDVVEEYEVKSVILNDIPENGDPSATISINNTGNVPSGPDGATFELFNKFGDVRLAFAQLEGDIEEASSFAESEISLTFPLDITIGVGEYWGHIKLYDDQSLVREERTVFRVRDDIAAATNRHSEAEEVKVAAEAEKEDFELPMWMIMAGVLLAGMLGTGLLVYFLMRRMQPVVDEEEDEYEYEEEPEPAPVKKKPAARRKPAAKTKTQSKPRERRTKKPKRETSKD